MAAGALEQEQLNGGAIGKSAGSCSWWWLMSKKRKSLVIVIVALSLLAVILLGYVIVVATRQNGANNDEEIRSVCLTRDCIESAEMLSQYMDPAVDPCQDFYLHSCGGYIRKHEKDRMEWNVMNPFIMLGVEAYNAIKNILENPDLKTKSEAVSKLKLSYHTCITDMSSNDEVDSYKKLIRALADEVVGQWPPDMRDFNLDETLGVLLAFQIPSLFQLEFGYNAEYTIALYQMTTPESQNFDDETLSAYKSYITEVLQKLNFPEYASVAEDIVQFEEELSKLIQYQDILEGEYKPSELEELFPFLKWTVIFDKFLSTSGFEADADEAILLEIRSEQYLISLNNLLEETPTKKIYSYLLWKFIHWATNYLGQPIRKARLVNDFSSGGDYTSEPVWKTCLDTIHPGFRKAMTAEYANVMFNEDRLQDVEEEFALIKDSFRKNIPLHDWIDNETKKATEMKLKHLQVITGYPPNLLIRESLDRSYDDVNIKEEDFLYNLLQIKKYMTNEHLSLMGQDADGSWDYDPTDINAFNFQFKNLIVIPISILSPPFYQFNRPQYLNFASLGSTLAHEMGHTFDNTGIMYSLDGSENFWSQKMIDKYMDKARCYLQQYSSYALKKKRLVLKWNVNATLSDDIADQVGLLHAYSAYVEHETKFGKEPGLPGLDYTNNQLFFLMYAQQFCTVYTHQGFLNAVRGDHTPEQFRVIGSIQNSPHFGEIFNCPLGSPMNPKEKCKLWE